MFNNKKDIGSSWIGEIPNGWITKRIKDITINLGGGNYGEDEGNEGIILPCISISDFKNGDLSNTSNIKMNRVYKKKNIIKQGSILIEKSGGGEKVPVGRTIYLINDLESYYTNFVQGVKVIGNNSKFINYCFQVIHKNKLHMDSVKQTTGLQNFDFNKFSNYFQIPIPNIKTQQSIVSFLDIETLKIDCKISILEQKFDKLEYYKQSVIFETVTKGLDKNVSMKDSGIDWIGDIPEHWEVKRVKDLYMLKKGKNAGLYSADFIHDELNKGQFPVYSGQTENQGIMGNIKTFEYNFSNGVLFTTTVGAKAMSVKRLFHKFSLSQNCALLIPTKSIDLSYSYYSIASCFSFARQSIPSHMQPSLRKEDLNTFYCLDIPIKEQKEIGLCLDSFSLKIDKKKEIINKKIKLLQEYKQSVIFEAVTGKMEIL